MILDLVKLARPKQWLKGVFVLVGPLYAAATGVPVDWVGAAFAFVAFGLASSACYVVNDIRDAALDRAHPRKRHRPIASGRVPVRTAWTFAAVLLAAAAVAIGVRPMLGPDRAGQSWLWLVMFVALYVVNVNAYSAGIKRVVVLDVVSLASGFVLRVLGGCAAAEVEPSTWLLNCTLFISMFLAFGKRLGERRTMGDAGAAGVRSVQADYTDDSLRMFLVVTGVACLVTYAGYVQAQAGQYTPVHVSAERPGEWGFNLLWLTMLPATFGLLRCVVQIERGAFDDPTELATRDRPFQLAAGCFAVLTVAAVWLGRGGA